MSLQITASLAEPDLTYDDIVGRIAAGSDADGDTMEYIDNTAMGIKRDGQPFRPPEQPHDENGGRDPYVIETLLKPKASLFATASITHCIALRR